MMKLILTRLSIKLSVGLFILSIGIFSGGQVLCEEWSAAQKAIWAMEKKFWISWQKEGGDSLIDFHAKEAIIWPSDFAFPKGRTFTSTAYYYGVGSHIDSFDLTPHEIRNFGNVAVVQYEAKVNSLGRQFKIRLSHSWMKQNGQWKIIGAMQDSCSKLPKCP